MMTMLLLIALFSPDGAMRAPDATPIRAVWLADLRPERVHSGTVGRFVFVPGSAVDVVAGCVLVEAAGPPGVLRTVSFAAGETDEGLEIAQPIVPRHSSPRGSLYLLAK